MKLLSNKTAAKIVSVLIAVLTWMYVVSVENPSTEISFRDVPVTVLNESKLSDYGLKLIDSGQKDINVRVEGRRSDVALMTANDITATIDVSDIKISGKYMLDIKIDTNADGISLKRSDVQKTEVYVDAVRSINQNVNVKTNGLPKNGYVIGETAVSMESVEITGPSGIINKIASASVEVNVEGVDSKITRLCPIKLYELSGDEIDTKYLSLSSEDITVNLDILKEHSLEIIPVYSENYDLSQYEVVVTPQSVTAVTEKGYTGGINTVPITLSKSELDRGETFTKKVKLEVPATIEIKQEVDKVTVEFRHK